MAWSKKELCKYKERLEEMYKKFLQSLEVTTAEVKSPDDATGYSQHQADEGTDDFDRTINLEITSSGYSILKQIERALEKIEEGTFGTCDVSGKPISKKRLDAVPYATVTIEVQEKMEKGLL